MKPTQEEQERDVRELAKRLLDPNKKAYETLRERLIRKYGYEDFRFLLLRAYRLGLSATVLVAGLALGAGCAEVRVPGDAAPSDAAPAPSGCFTLRNTLETRAPACPWRDWGCPLSGLETEAEVAACNEALYTAGSDCAVLEATLAECAR